MYMSVSSPPDLQNPLLLHGHPSQKLALQVLLLETV